MKALPIKKTLSAINEVLHLPFYQCEKIDIETFKDKKYNTVILHEKILTPSDCLEFKVYNTGTIKNRQYERLICYKNGEGLYFCARLNSVLKLNFNYTEALLKATHGRGIIGNGGLSIYKCYFKHKPKLKTNTQTQWEF